jgi:hypothetical protein
MFPVGSVCIIERWVWQRMIFKKNGMWLKSWAWGVYTKRTQLKSTGYWVQIPTARSVLSDRPQTTQKTPNQAQKVVW